ncbi:DUF732 domain-containing protein [Mycobacterium sp. Marseille-P9652]|uniref:DUF732 domain-containing protein n=1 Tax=Mycobacterium sp. Marseille-P9652 TaxID=2654950 RepID=UPI001E3052FC|nr:DUF732 domain-containing protein [Mycobacterium sp. Marseille-P9652]
MSEPGRAGDETVAVNAADTVAVPDTSSKEADDLAWSRDDEEVTAQPAPDRQSWSATWRKAGALLLGGLALAVAIVVGFWVLSPSGKSSSPSPAAPPSTSSAAPPSASAAAPPSIASTPEQDNKYVQDLNNRGISFANPEAAVYNGKIVCTDIRQGMTVPQIVDAFRASNPALGADAEAYVAISVRAYCPQNANLVSGVS